MKCLSLVKLLNYLQNPAENRERNRVDAHLATGCQVCNENLKWVEMVISITAEDRSFEFSEETIAAIVAQFKERAAAGLRPIRQYIAELIFDSGLLPQFAGGRPDSEEPTGRRALYHAEGYDIDLRFVLSDENNDERLIGQVRPEQWDTPELAPFKVQLIQDGSVISAANTDGRGVFKFAHLISGIYDMKVSVPDGEINLERVPTARAL